MANVPDDSKSYFSQEQLPDPLPPQLNIVPTPTGSQVEDGSLRSPNYRAGQSGWTINSDGSAEFQDIQTGNIKIQQSTLASETISEGIPVGVDFEGKIARALRAFPDDATNQPTVTANTFGGILGVFPYSTNTFVVVYEQTVSVTDYWKAVVATVSSSTNDVSFGTPTTIRSDSANFYTTSASCQIDTGTFIVGLGTQAGGEDIIAIAFTYNGTSFSVGSDKVISVADNYSSFSCCKSDTNAFAFWATTGAIVTHGYCTVSGTTITVETFSTATITNISNAVLPKLAQVGPGKVAILAPANGYVAIATASSSTWTVGTAVDIFDSSGDWSTCSMVSMASDTCYAHLGTRLAYFTISGTTPTLQGSLVTRAGSEGGLVKNGTTLYDFQSNGTTTKDCGLWTVDYDGASLNVTQISENVPKTGVLSSMISSDGSRMLVITNDLSYWISSMAYNFIGFTTAYTPKNTSGLVTLRGIETVYPTISLLSGASYLVSNGSLTRISPVETVNTLDDVVNVVKAVSSTQILV